MEKIHGVLEMGIYDNQELMRRIDLGVRRGVARAIAEHKKAGRSIVVWRDGKVVKVPPEDIQVPKEPTEDGQ